MSGNTFNTGGTSTFKDESIPNQVKNSTVSLIVNGYLGLRNYICNTDDAKSAKTYVNKGIKSQIQTRLQSIWRAIKAAPANDSNETSSDPGANIAIVENIVPANEHLQMTCYRIQALVVDLTHSDCKDDEYGLTESVKNRLVAEHQNLWTEVHAIPTGEVIDQSGLDSLDGKTKTAIPGA